jgi:hypothetical protein
MSDRPEAVHMSRLMSDLCRAGGPQTAFAKVNWLGGPIAAICADIGSFLATSCRSVPARRQIKSARARAIGVLRVRVDYTQVDYCRVPTTRNLFVPQQRYVQLGIRHLLMLQRRQTMLDIEI